MNVSQQPIDILKTSLYSGFLLRFIHLIFKFYIYCDNSGFLQNISCEAKDFVAPGFQVPRYYPTLHTACLSYGCLTSAINSEYVHYIFLKEKNWVFPPRDFS